MAAPVPTGDVVRDFLTLALSRYQTAKTDAEPNRLEMAIDNDFLALKQWDQAVYNDRNVAGKERPCLVIDQIGEPYRHRIGQQRRARPALTVSPVDDRADKDTAEILQGLYRHVESTGGAKSARDEAFKGGVGPGEGYYRLLTDYAGPDTFDQDVVYHTIDDPFTVLEDPAARCNPYRRRYAFVVENIPKTEFEKKYEGVPSTSQAAFELTGSRAPDWYPEGAVLVADYYYVEDVPGGQRCLMSDGRSLKKAEADQAVAASQLPPNREVLGLGQPLPKPVTIIETRPVTIPKVKLAKITGGAILEGNPDKTAGRDQVWPFIPIVPMYGESLTVNGHITHRGMVRPARDTQRMYNFLNSEYVAETSYTPKTKVMLAVGQDEGLEAEWENVYSSASPLVHYNAKTVDGVLIGPPVPAHFVDVMKLQSLTIAINQAKSDLRTITGFYDSSDPGRKNTDQSGRAIEARKQAQDEGSVNYTENFQLSLLFEAALMLGAEGRPGAIQQVYRAGRAIRILGIDGESETITLGQPYAKDANGDRTPVQPGQQSQGMQQVYDLSAGRYDFTVSVGASYATRRQEAADDTMNLMKILPPEMAAAAAPTMVRNMDGPGMEALADILEQALPPELRPKKDDDPAAQIPPQIRQQMEQAQQALNMLTQEVNRLHDEQQAKTVELDAGKAIKGADIQSKLEIEQMKIEASERQAQRDLELEMAKLATAERVAEAGNLVKLAIAEMQAKQADAHDEAESIRQQQDRDATMALASKRKKVTKTVRNDADGGVAGSEEIHEALD